MSHMVIYRGADGKPGYQQAEDIHDAVTFVEQMRNEEGVEHARIFRLEEVVFEYRPYYRVELAGLSSAGGALPASSNGAAAGLTNGNGGAPMMVGLPSESSPEPAVASLDEPFSVVESTTINIDDPDGETVAGNGARRGLFGR
ncbi:MAG: hypothetical protein R2761_17390 [Acidimicrobiales bacterium]